MNSGLSPFVRHEVLQLDVFGMKNGQIGYLLEVILFVKSQNVTDTVVFHDDAVNDVPNARMIPQDTLPDMIEELCEVIILLGAHLKK